MSHHGLISSVTNGSKGFVQPYKNAYVNCTFLLNNNKGPSSIDQSRSMLWLMEELHKREVS
jgi:hypothetical protein